MTKTEIKKRIQEAIEKLNKMDNNVFFKFEENEWSAQIICESRTSKGTRFGAYGYMGLFDEYKNKTDAYVNCMLFSEMLIKATELNNPKAYHNLKI